MFASCCLLFVIVRRVLTKQTISRFQFVSIVFTAGLAAAYFGHMRHLKFPRTKSLFAHLLAVFILSGTALSATFTVDRTDDLNISACTGAANDCTLRGAVTAANAAGGVDTINFDGTVFAGSQTITLTMGELVITSTGTLSITGTGANILTISGNNLSRVFSNSVGTNTTISGLTVTAGNGLGATTSGFGGGVYNAGTLTLTEVTVTGNASQLTSNGGGVYNQGGTVTVLRSTIDNNTGDTGGGGILNFVGGILNLTNSTVSGNTANSGGGGGIVNIGTVFADSSTIVSNSSPTAAGGGVLVAGGTFNSTSSIYADNTASSNADFSGTLTSGDYNLVEDTTGTTITPLFEPLGKGDKKKRGPLNLAANDITGVDPMLAPLALIGGTTRTHRAITGSPVIDQGNSGQATDQRGNARPIDFTGIADAPGGNATDIGAVENLIPTATVATIGGRITTSQGLGIPLAYVKITTQDGIIRYVRTNQFGYYRISEIEVGQNLFIEVFAKGYQFSPLLERILRDRKDLDFQAQ